MENGVGAKGYYEAWLRRAQKALAKSGRATELAMLLSQKYGEGPKVWRERLHEIQIGGSDEGMDFELLTKIDVVLAGGRTEKGAGDSEDQFFL